MCNQKETAKLYKALYRKWRPRKFDDVIGQSHITDILKSEVSTERISHAYLFVGSRGIGKTTCAKILSRAVNCQNPVNGNPCEQCEICKSTESETELDIVEIDAASNNGVENIRDMREELVYTPTKCKYRVYIVDEVHMLSTGAFNAFLKTLEEPPAHVIFILATTESHKLPATIVSRCQKFVFHRVSNEDICARLKYICEQEKIEIEDDALNIIAQASDGGMRDALSILDQCFNINKSQKITEEIVKNILGITGQDVIKNLCDIIFSGNNTESLEFLENIHKQSVNLLKFCEDLIKYFRDIMIEIVTKKNKNLILEDILYSLEILQETHRNINFGNDRKISLEIAIIKLCSRFSGKNKSENKIQVKKEPEEPQENIIKNTSEIDISNINTELTDNLTEWQDILTEMQKDSSLKSLCMSLKNSQAFKHENYILIKSTNSMAFELLRKAECRNSLKKIIHKILGKAYNIGPYNSENLSKTNNNNSILDSIISKAKLHNILEEN